MKKINILYTVIALSASFLYSCQQEYEAPNQFSDIMYTTSYGTINSQLNGTIAVVKNFYLTFMDLSQGTISHEWSIANQDGLTLLSQGFSPEFKDTTSRQNHVIADTISLSKTVNVFFKKEGKFTITLRNVFRDSVSYNNVAAVHDLKTGYWVFTKVFTLEVYGPLIPVVTILKNNSELISTSTDTIHILVGDSIVFSEASLGHPTSRTWKINGGTPSSSTKSKFTTTFYTAGIYSASLALNRTSNISTIISYGLFSLPVIKVQ